MPNQACGRQVLSKANYRVSPFVGGSEFQELHIGKFVDLDVLSKRSDVPCDLLARYYEDARPHPLCYLQRYLAPICSTVINTVTLPHGVFNSPLHANVT